MRTLTFLLGLICSLPLLAVEIGDSYDQVIAEKGKPSARLEMGDTVVLNYPDQRIKLQEQKVIEVSKVRNAPPPPVADNPPPPARPKVAPPAPARPNPAPAAPAVALKWRTDYEDALADARRSRSKVFLFFTGSDWCSWCHRIEREILSTTEFKAYAEKSLVLVKLDFPRGFSLSSDLKAQNDLLAKRFRVRGYPTIHVLNSSGRSVAELGYQQGGPAPFIAALEKL